MATMIRAELSKKNRYYIPKHRFYELKHFCLQYPEWKAIVHDIYTIGGACFSEIKVRSDDPIGRRIEKAEPFLQKMAEVENAAKIAGEDLYPYLLRGVTEGISWEKMDVPCYREGYYERYRYFFHLLDKSRK